MEDVQLLTYSSCTLPGLAGVYGCGDDEGGVEIQFNLEAKCAGSPHVVKSTEDCCCFCQSSAYDVAYYNTNASSTVVVIVNKALFCCHVRL